MSLLIVNYGNEENNTTPPTPNFPPEITMQNLSRKNQEKWKRIQHFHQTLQALEQNLSDLNIGEDTTPFTTPLQNAITKHPLWKGILSEHTAMVHTKQEILWALERQANTENSSEITDDAYTFNAIYNTKFFQKMTESINRDSNFWKPISAGVWAQYKVLKETMEKSPNQYETDEYGNTDFAFSHVFCMESVGQPIKLPLTARENMELATAMSENVAQWRAYLSEIDEDTEEALQEHYQKLKNAFQQNVLNIILGAENSQYMYEAFVRTDLLRRQVKSVWSLESAFDQLLLLAKKHEDTEFMAVIEHLLNACIAHKHSDDTNSGNFRAHTEHCFNLINKSLDTTQWHEAYTAQKLNEVASPLYLQEWASFRVRLRGYQTAREIRIHDGHAFFEVAEEGHCSTCRSRIAHIHSHQTPDTKFAYLHDRYPSDGKTLRAGLPLPKAATQQKVISLFKEQLKLPIYE